MSGSQRDHAPKDEHMMTYVTLGIMALAIGAVLWFFCRYSVLIFLLGPAWLEFKILVLLGINTVQAEKWLAWLTAVFDGRIKAKTVDLTGIEICLAHASYLSSILFGGGFLGLITWSIFKSKPKTLQREFSLGGYVYGDVAWVADIRAPQWLGEALLIPMNKNRFFQGVAKTLKVRVTKARISNGTNFIAEQAREWRQVSCVIEFDPTDCIPSLWDGLSPEYWAAFSGLISKEAAYRLAYRKPYENLGVIEWDVSKAGFALAAQIEKGGEWAGVLKAPPFIQAVCLIAVLNRKVNNPALIKLAGQCSDIARSLFALPAKATGGEIAARRHEAVLKIEKVVKKLLTKENVELIDTLAAGHQYNRTAAISVIGKCGPNKGDWGGGSFGVLQSSLFLWVKPIDRCLFFCCQCVGVPTYQPEAAGPIAQFQAEELARELHQSPPKIWVEGPLRWLEGFIERFEDGPYDGDIAPFEDVGEPQPGVDY